MYMYGELPSDLDEMEESLGPPPAWFRPEQGITNPQQAYWAQTPQYGYGYGGLGDRESEMEVNPVEGLRDLKYQQEMNKKIPIVANRYTEIDPLSPLFRDKKAKFGFGELGSAIEDAGKKYADALAAAHAPTCKQGDAVFPAMSCDPELAKAIGVTARKLKSLQEAAGVPVTVTIDEVSKKKPIIIVAIIIAITGLLWWKFKA